MSDDDGG
jgi:hypothetical protein